MLLGNGNGTFGTKANFATGGNPCAIVIADLNGDRKPDIATASYSANAISFLPGNGNGIFGPRTDYECGYAPVSLAVGNLDADRRTDLATANESSTLSVLLNIGLNWLGVPEWQPAVSSLRLEAPVPSPLRERGTITFSLPAAARPARDLRRRGTPCRQPCSGAGTRGRPPCRPPGSWLAAGRGLCRGDPGGGAEGLAEVRDPALIAAGA